MTGYIRDMDKIDIENELKNLNDDDTGGYAVVCEQTVMDLLEWSVKNGFSLSDVYVTGHEEGMLEVLLDSKLCNFSEEERQAQW